MVRAECRHGADGSERYGYRVFGITVASDFAFEHLPTAASARPDLTVSLTATAPLGVGPGVSPVYVGPRRTESGEHISYLYQQRGCDLMRFTDMFDFYVWSDRIVCHSVDETDSQMLQIYLLGTVLSYWLERQGIPVLHASAVAVNGRAVSFLSHSTRGKSVLAAALMQAGHALLTDDILPIEGSGGKYLGRPGHAQMRMWPHEALHFLGRYNDLERVHPTLAKRRVPVGTGGFGTFCESSLPLACIYLPERRDPTVEADIRFAPISARDAVIELLGHSFTPAVVEAIGLQPQRLDFFARLAEQVPVRRLTYPSGLEYLPRVREAILQDLDTLL